MRWNSDKKREDIIVAETTYRLKRLVYFEQTSDVHASLAREKQLKGWTRRRKIALIRSTNPDWSDLGANW